MSIQIVELLVFAGIAFLIISKLISVLGTTSDEDPTKNSSYFGEPSELKDVTENKEKTRNIIDVQFRQNRTLNQDELRALIVEANFTQVFDNYSALYQKLPSLNLSKFLHSTKLAFGMIIDVNATDEHLDKLIDKRYIEQFRTIISSYGSFLNPKKLDTKISDLCMFGNSVFIKILFTGHNITSQIENLNEEWTFTKSLIKSGNDWYLTNIDKLEGVHTL